MAPTKKSSTRREGFSADEKAAMKARVGEIMAEERGGGATAGVAAVKAAIAALPQPDRGLAEQVHALILTAAPDLEPKTWYGMPAYARQGQVVCFFQGASKFKARYATLGFSDKAHLDEGAMWPTSFAISKLDSTVEARIRALVKQATG